MKGTKWKNWITSKTIQKGKEMIQYCIENKYLYSIKEVERLFWIGSKQFKKYFLKFFDYESIKNNYGYPRKRMKLKDKYIKYYNFYIENKEKEIITSLLNKESWSFFSIITNNKWKRN